MCPQPLSDYIEPFKLARQSQVLEGNLPLAKMGRLARVLCSEKADVSIKSSFGIDAGGTYFARGTVTAKVEMECQRCMQAVPVELNAAFALAFVSSEKGVERVSDTYDPIVVQDEQVVLAELVEDELLLALPIVAKHQGEDCLPKFKNPSDAVVEEKPNPFAVLAQLKNATDD